MNKSADFIISWIIYFLLSYPLIAQEHRPAINDTLYKNSSVNYPDQRHSVFGPPGPASWKFQLSHMNSDRERVSSFNFYRKDQRDKTLFFSLLDNGLDNNYQYRVQQVSGGAILFPFNDDDRYQADLGATYDKIKETTHDNKIFFSRFTYRPSRALWMRAGFEYYDGHQLGHSGSSYINSTLNSYYLAASYRMSILSPVAVIGSGRSDGVVNNRFGGGMFLNGPFETYAFGGYIKSTDETENTRTLAFGRWAPFRPDGLPSGFFIWKHQSDYDFQLGGIMFGSRNRFVQPAAVGMLTGMFVSSITLRVNSQLRQRKLMAITDDYENSEYTFFYVHLNQKITPKNDVGFTVLQFFKLFTNTKIWIFSNPVIGIFYNEETNPVFDPQVFSLVNKKEDYLSYQAGFRFIDSFLMEVIHSPAKKDFTVALSYLLE